MSLLLALDQGTTSTRAIVFERNGSIVATASRELPQSYPQPGWVEHDAGRIWVDAAACLHEVVERCGDRGRDIAAMGITNQRETTIIWERESGRPIHPAIVWQDRRTSAWCREHADRGDWMSQRSGLLLDPYFSATKVAWILDQVPGARAAAEAGKLAFGTVDSWLIWRLTGGKLHVTDVTNACRTALMNIETLDWDDELLEFFRVPRALMPEIRDCSSDFGAWEAKPLGRPIPIRGVAGDQQAATIGQACFKPGMTKCTYGTGAFCVLNTGDKPQRSRSRLLTTVAYRIDGKAAFALEGSIFIAGAAVQWLRDAMQMIRHASDTASIAESIPDSNGVYLVPAFTGLGAPYWDPDARGALIGLTRDAGVAQIVRATLESVAYQTRDLLDAMAQDAPAPTELRVDGGMVANDWLVQAIADMLQKRVVRPKQIETTALGAAFLAGLGVGVYASLDDITKLWGADLTVEPGVSAASADARYAGWQEAVSRVRTNA